MSSQQSSSIALRFEQLKREGRMALMPFLMAGDPDLSVTAEVLLSLQASGADMVELVIDTCDFVHLLQSPAQRGDGAFL